MANSVTRINNSQDNKIYNIQQFGTFPVVVFGRTIKQNSVPGTQYYFQDGKVKIWEESTTENPGLGYQIVYYFGASTESPETPSGACIFTVPQDFDFSKMTTTSYVAQYCRSAKNLNADTVSPNYIIRNGEFICVKAFQFKEERENYSSEHIYGGIKTHILGEDVPRYYRFRRNKCSRPSASVSEESGKCNTYKSLHRVIKNNAVISTSACNWKNQFFIQPVGKRRKIGSIYKYCFRKRFRKYFDGTNTRHIYDYILFQ